jgi:HK97 family phage major capsid protein/HK97 family phage prohead protease
MVGVVDRASALLTIKSYDADRRTFSGIATTPTPDRAGDIFDPLGATFANPLPLLLHHDKARPVGLVTLGAPTADGITFDASIPEVPEAGVVRDRVDEAWHSIKAGLLRGVSIGFRPLKNGVELLKNKTGFRIKSSEICELSLVAIPSNVDATIHTIKSAVLAASGPIPPGVAGLPVVRVQDARTMTKQTIADQIAAYEKTRQAKCDRRDELMTKSAETNATLTDEQATEYDTLEKEIAAIDVHLERLKAWEARLIESATPAPAVVPHASPVRAGSGTPVIVRSNVEPGTDFVRYCKALLASHGDRYMAIETAKQWRDSTPNVELALKAAVAPATTTDTAWAGYLVPPLRQMAQEFIALLRNATIVGRLDGLRRVPFNVQVPMQTTGGMYKWVGQAAAKPVTAAAFGVVTLTQAKIAGIIVFTDELARSSAPDAETLFRADMIAGISAFMDQQFIDPAVAAVANVSPASITNGLTGTAATGDARHDIATLLGKFVAANIPLSSIVLIMSELNAFNLSLQQNPLGQPMYPGLGVGGGTINGIRVVTSQTAGSNIIAVAPSYILYADDGGVSIDVSREASVQMNDTPDSPITATTVLRSLWQENMIGLRAERYCTWKRALDGAVQYLTGAAWQPTPATGAAEPLGRNATHRASPPAA